MSKSKAMVKAESKGKFIHRLFGRTRSVPEKSSIIRLSKRLPTELIDKTYERLQEKI